MGERFLAVASGFVLLACSACSSSEGAEGSTAGPPLGGSIEAYGPDVSDFQRSVAKRIADGGEVTWADYQRVTDDAIACIADQGYFVDGPIVGHLMGQDYLVFTVEAPDELVDPVTGAAPVVEAVIEDCSRRYSAYVRSLWETQGGSIEWQDSVFEEYRIPILQCLRDHGIEIAEDAVRSVIEESMRDLIETEPDRGGPNCADISGINDEYRMTYD